MTSHFFWKNFRYAILIVAIVAAVITPTPNAASMLKFMAPVVGLFFLSIGVSVLVHRKGR